MQHVRLHELENESVASEFDPSATEPVIPVEESEALMSIDGVEGFGLSDDNQLLVYLRDRDIRSKLPEKIGGLEISVRVVGEVRSLRTADSVHHP